MDLSNIPSLSNAPAGSYQQQPAQQPAQQGAQPPVPPAQPQQQQPPAAQPMPNGMQQQPPTPAAPTVTDPTLDPANTQGGSPLDKFVQKDDNKGDGKKPEEKPTTSIFDNNVADYAKQIEGADFVGQLDEQTLQAIQGGDTSALVGVINAALRQGVATAAWMSGQVARHGMETQFNGFREDVLPGMLNDHAVTQQFSNNKHEILNHPAVQPLVEAQTNTIRQQFPQASAAEVQEKVVEFFTDFSKVMGMYGQQQNVQPTEDPSNTNTQGGLSALFDL